jgi:hypothetical protein
MRTTLVLMIIVSSYNVLSQIPPEEVDGMYVNWSAATMSLVSGEEFDCEIRFDQLNQNMEVNYQGNLLEIPQNEIKAFNFYDSIKQQRRFFEKIIIPSGKIIMMEYLFQNSKTAILQERFIRSFHMVYPSATTLERQDFYYTAPVEKKFLLLKNTGKALVLSKQNLLSLLQNNKEEVNSFISQNKLDLENIDDCIKVLNFYDSL